MQGIAEAWLVVGQITDPKIAKEYGPGFKVGDPEWRLLDHPTDKGASVGFPTRGAAMEWAATQGIQVHAGDRPAAPTREEISAALSLDDPVAAYVRLTGDRKGARNLAACPEHLQGGLMRYAAVGIPPGSMLRALLRNDLDGAHARADPIAQAGMREVVAFTARHLPERARGSDEAIRKWGEVGGLVGRPED